MGRGRRLGENVSDGIRIYVQRKRQHTLKIIKRDVWRISSTVTNAQKIGKTSTSPKPFTLPANPAHLSAQTFSVLNAAVILKAGSHHVTAKTASSMTEMKWARGKYFSTFPFPCCWPAPAPPNPGNDGPSAKAPPNRSDRLGGMPPGPIPPSPAGSSTSPIIPWPCALGPEASEGSPIIWARSLDISGVSAPPPDDCASGVPNMDIMASS